ncbi:D-alanyl-D-alanine carboxypeptidase [Candidatus Kaiserbacteria bacterium]|nr:D-alanyl-D-alanine carboxypeptidase [Candidatus Kaiserbacteria bacterium]
MRALLATILFSSVGLLCFVPTSAYETPAGDAPSYTTDGTKIAEVSARAWGIFDAESGNLLWGHNEDTAYPIASVTKLMTALVTLDTLDLEATTTLSRRAIATEGRAGGLAAGEVFSIRELLFPLILSSSNDAAEAIAEYEGRDIFIAAMNNTAQSLDMVHTGYDEPSGLSPRSVSSVSDLAKLALYLVRERPYLMDVSQLDTYVGEDHAWRNINPASHLATYRGGKHGYTDEANRTLVSFFEEETASGAPRMFLVVLLGSNDLKADMATLRAYLQSDVWYE